MTLNARGWIAYTYQYLKFSLGEWCWLKKGHLRIGFILLAVLLLLDVDPPEPTAPFPEGLLEFISADFWKTSMVALAMFSKREYSSYCKANTNYSDYFSWQS